MAHAETTYTSIEEALIHGSRESDEVRILSMASRVNLAIRTDGYRDDDPVWVATMLDCQRQIDELKAEYRAKWGSEHAENLYRQLRVEAL